LIGGIVLAALWCKPGFAVIRISAENIIEESALTETARAVDLTTPGPELPPELIPTDVAPESDDLPTPMRRVVFPPRTPQPGGESPSQPDGPVEGCLLVLKETGFDGFYPDYDWWLEKVEKRLEGVKVERTGMLVQVEAEGWAYNIESGINYLDGGYWEIRLSSFISEPDTKKNDSNMVSCRFSRIKIRLYFDEVKKEWKLSISNNSGP
jgi:hypothetical protein